MTKAQRQHRISELIEREVISTAAQIVARLQSEGIPATQATVTRDLQELGTIKMRDEHGSRRIVVAATPKISSASPGAVVLHCLPAHRGDEITDDVLDGPQSVVWRQVFHRRSAMRGALRWIKEEPR